MWSDKEARAIAKKLARVVEDEITIDVDSKAEVDRPLTEDGIWVATWVFVPNNWSETNG